MGDSGVKNQSGRIGIDTCFKKSSRSRSVACSMADAVVIETRYKRGHVESTAS